MASILDSVIPVGAMFAFALAVPVVGQTASPPLPSPLLKVQGPSRPATDPRIQMAPKLGPGSIGPVGPALGQSWLTPRSDGRTIFETAGIRLVPRTSRERVLSGDFNGDGAGDLAYLYDIGGLHVRLQLSSFDSLGQISFVTRDFAPLWGPGVFLSPVVAQCDGGNRDMLVFPFENFGRMYVRVIGWRNGGFYSSEYNQSLWGAGVIDRVVPMFWGTNRIQEDILFAFVNAGRLEFRLISNRNLGVFPSHWNESVLPATGIWSPRSDFQVLVGNFYDDGFLVRNGGSDVVVLDIDRIHTFLLTTQGLQSRVVTGGATEWVRAKTAVADVDNDGFDEIVALHVGSTSMNVSVLNYDGNLWRHTTQTDSIPVTGLIDSFHQMDVKDIDADGRADLMVSFAGPDELVTQIYRDLNSLAAAKTVRTTFLGTLTRNASIRFVGSPCVSNIMEIYYRGIPSEGTYFETYLNGAPPNQVGAYLVDLQASLIGPRPVTRAFGCDFYSDLSSVVQIPVVSDAQGRVALGWDIAFGSIQSFAELTGQFVFLSNFGPQGLITSAGLRTQIGG